MSPPPYIFLPPVDLPPSPPPPLEDIGFDWTEEQIFTYLEQIVGGNRFPSNVLTNVNPFDVLPSTLSQNVWYFNEEDVVIPENNYWDMIEEDTKTFANSPTIGVKSLLQFNTGQYPNGTKTNWMMHSYRIDYIRLLEINQQHDARSLCRVYYDGERIPQNQDGSDNILDNLNEIIQDEAPVPNVQPTEEARDPSFGDWIQGVNENNDLAIEDHGFSNEGYIELLDLDEPLLYDENFGPDDIFEPDEYFDADELLWEIENNPINQDEFLWEIENNPINQQNHADNGSHGSL